MWPINAAHQGYRRAKLWAAPPHEQLRIDRVNVDWQTAQRGAVQYEILEGEDALAFADGDRFQCKVNCTANAGDLDVKVAFALFSFEVSVGSEIAVLRRCASASCRKWGFKLTPAASQAVPIEKAARRRPQQMERSTHVLIERVGHHNSRGRNRKGPVVR